MWCSLCHYGNERYSPTIVKRGKVRMIRLPDGKKSYILADIGICGHCFNEAWFVEKRPFKEKER